MKTPNCPGCAYIDEPITYPVCVQCPHNQADRGTLKAKDAGKASQHVQKPESVRNRTTDAGKGKLGGLSLILPLPPSLNHAYITTKQGKRIMTAECRDYKEGVILQLKGLFKKPLPKLSLIQYRFFLPDNRKRDIPDNYSKVLRDCLKDTLVEDDSWQCVKKEDFGPHEIDKENPRVEIYWEV